jgi:hypothetical protein
VAIVLTITILPFFNELANKKLSLSYLTDMSLYRWILFAAVDHVVY